MRITLSQPPAPYSTPIADHKGPQISGKGEWYEIGEKYFYGTWIEHNRFHGIANACGSRVWHPVLGTLSARQRDWQNCVSLLRRQLFGEGRTFAWDEGFVTGSAA